MCGLSSVCAVRVVRTCESPSGSPACYSAVFGIQYRFRALGSADALMCGGAGRKGSRAVAEVPGQGPDQWAAQTGFTVLVAKVLTPSDANSGRIILPRTMVEANLNFVMGYRFPPPSVPE